MLKAVRYGILFTLMWGGGMMPTKAATRVEGIATYEVFRFQVTNHILIVKEQFSMVFDKEKWLLRTTVLSTDPPIPPQLFCPPTQEVGSDGEDIYYLKEIPASTNNEIVGWIEPGCVPNMEQSPSACVLWLAYCSDRYLEENGEQELKPFWIASHSRNQMRQDKCRMPISVVRSSKTNGFLEKLYYLSDGRVDPCNPGRGATNLYSAPWRTGFTQSVFTVNSTFGPPSSASVPENFEVNLLAPNPYAKLPELNVITKMAAFATNVETDIEVNSWLPTLPENRRVSVRDYRFTETVTNWDMVRYIATNNFYGRTNKLLRQAVRIHETTRAVPRSQSDKANPSLIRVFLVMTIAVPLFVLVAIKLKNYNKKRNI